MRAAFLVPALAALLSGCVHYTTTSTAAPTQVGDRGSEPAGFASGETAATWVLGLGPFGSESPDKAIARARGHAIETELSDVTVERKVSCFPECTWPLIKRVRVVASGSLLKPTGYRDADKPPAPEPVITQRFPTPSAQTLVDRLKSFYKNDPAGAESYYSSLKNETQKDIEDFVVSQSGLLPTYGKEFRAPAATTADDCRFLRWFLHEHTTYRLSADSCVDALK